jgi:hypothetical protein
MSRIRRGWDAGDCGQTRCLVTHDRRDSAPPRRSSEALSGIFGAALYRYSLDGEAVRITASSIR